MIYINDEPVIIFDPIDPSISKDIEEPVSVTEEGSVASETPLC